MSYTKFGEFMRVQRIKHHEVMGDTAKLLGVTVPLISAVENGKKNVPESWIPVIVEHFGLTIQEQQELSDAVKSSRTHIKINLTSASTPQRKAALQFQRSFESLDEKTAAEIISLLSKGDC